MGFAQAAGEPNVTPAALSFQIKSLEEHLGQSLFRRLNRAVEFTEAVAIQPTRTVHAIDAALAGGGVALGRISLAYGALSNGSLVVPFPLAMAIDSHYRFVWPKGAEGRPQITDLP